MLSKITAGYTRYNNLQVFSKYTFFKRYTGFKFSRITNVYTSFKFASCTFFSNVNKRAVVWNVNQAGCLQPK